MQQRSAVGELLGELVRGEEGQGQTRLWIHVDQEHPPPTMGDLRAKVCRDRGLADTALVVEYRDDAHDDAASGPGRPWQGGTTVTSQTVPKKVNIGYDRRPGPRRRYRLCQT